MDPGVAGLVLLSALLHATWNAVVKSDEDHLTSFALVNAVGGVVGLLAISLVPRPAVAAWPCLGVSIAVHNAYYFCLLRSYAAGDLSHVYPIARGLGPLLVAAASGAVVGEHLGTLDTAGVVLVSAGIMSLALTGGFPRGAEWRAPAYATVTGLTIATYTLLDGLGARRSGEPLGYVVWLNLLEGPWVLLVAIGRRGRGILPYLGRCWWRGAAGGVIATVSYGIAVWALTMGAMARVAALRETSALFGALIGAVLLSEPFGARRVAAAAVVVTGLLLMNY
ncbi:MAG TPA: DMT family transporter [Candidatus Nitrosopolaris sp.]|nr:DMT family transporter [Candidatus Nitrosopolaris sp.]